MNHLRQDAWTKEEDRILAETILNYVKKGGTQLDAFKDVAIQLNRTAAACGFRWNATIRKLYEEEIEFAKEERKKDRTFETLHKPNSTGIDTAIQLLQQMKTNYEQDGLEHEYEMKTRIEELKKENNELKLKIERYATIHNEIKKQLNFFER